MRDFKEITRLMSNPSKSDIDLIKKAFDFAKNAHEGQKRYSGEPYFNHCFATAKILANLGMGATTIAAGLLHDTLEDAQVKTEQIEEEFGKEILFLIEGVTKLGKLRYAGAKRHLESLRKLFISMSQDIRVLIIKLADRLHNMRTLEYVPEEKRKRIALETLEIYAPLAYRLSIKTINRELEDLAFRYVYPDEYKNVKQMMEERAKKSITGIEKTISELKKQLVKEQIKDVEIDYRIKSLNSLYLKWLRKEQDVEKIYDITALRLQVSTVSDCYKAMGVVHKLWKPLPGRIKDYVAFPKPNGYKSLHTTVITGDRGIIEIQIRTKQMHEEAEYGIASHIAYKEKKKKDSWISSWFGKNEQKSASSSLPEWVRSLAEVQGKTADSEEFMKNLKTDFFRYRVFVFTPNGDVVDLPTDSSPIDFAYAIHTEIGDHVSGAKVNGKMVSLDTKLQNGDIVEIMTNPKSSPKQKWLEVVGTTIARRRIKTYLSRQQNQI
jgi:GTP pyrophosphokinase